MQWFDLVLIGIGAIAVVVSAVFFVLVYRG